MGGEIAKGVSQAASINAKVNKQNKHHPSFYFSIKVLDPSSSPKQKECTHLQDSYNKTNKGLALLLCYLLLNTMPRF